MKLLVATQNQGKLKEFQRILASLNVTLVTPQDVSLADLDVAETAETFAGNALLKTTAFCEASQLPTVADDSGLEVFAFDGFPGVHSNRWHAGSDQDRNQAILEKMAHLKTDQERAARFVTVLCWLSSPDAEPEYFEGEIRGHIATESAGSAGFGYDPLFVPEGYDQTFGELGDGVKDELSHRSRAIAKFKTFLETK